MQCNVCGLPYSNVSYGGPGVCPSCDCGRFRDGTKWTFRDTTDADYRKKRAEEHQLKKAESK